MIKIIKMVLLILLNSLGVNALFRLLNRNKILILWYHGISDDDFTLLKGYDERHVPKSLFKKQLIYLKQKGYRFITMSELIEILNKNSEINNSVVLTFDDGFENVIKNAYPLLKEFRAKGVLYVISDLVGGKKIVWTDYIESLVRSSSEDFKFHFKDKTITYKTDTEESCREAMRDIKRKLRSISDSERISHMEQFKNYNIDAIPKEFYIADWQQIENLDRNILAIGGHTKTHSNCTSLTTDKEIEDELKNSKKDIEKKVGYKIDHFCYPAGVFNEEIINKLKEFGYLSAVTTLDGLNSNKFNPYILKRICVNEDFFLFKATTSGSYYFIKQLVKKILGKKS